ncbi:hypothetical protein [Streptomyces omiyaensis]|uniref:hypothetical protein n=1 Tax=Streptomyces omiyaensis TaxID=68247 RepID=UPI0036FE658B
MLDPGIRSRSPSPGPDTPERLRIPADGYGLPTGDRAEVTGVIEQATEVCRSFVARRAAGGDPVRLQAPAERGGRERWDRVQTWPVDPRRTFTAALPK